MRSLHRAICLGTLVCAASCVTDTAGTGRAAESDVDDVSARDGVEGDAPDVVVDGADAAQKLPDAEVPGALDAGDVRGDGEDAADAGASEPEPVEQRLPGSRCTCDVDCAGGPANRGVCIAGLCMTAASAPCSGPGSRAECAAGGTCWGLENFAGDVCWPDCMSFTCEGACDANGHCVHTVDTSCNAACGVLCEAHSP